MKNVYDFATAAMPWIAIGLMLAILAAKAAQKRDNPNREDYGLLGTLLGITLGGAIGQSVFASYSMGMTLGMALGFCTGSLIKKAPPEENKPEQ